MYLSNTILIIARLFAVAANSHEVRHPPCPLLPAGKITINAFQLYPENMDWDPKLCQGYMSILYSTSIGLFTPYSTPSNPNGTLSVLPIPLHSQTLNPTYHIAAIVHSPFTSQISAIVTQSLIFRTAGLNISGNNFLNRYDPISKQYLWFANLTTVSLNRYGGFNDLAYDTSGNAFVCGRFPSTVLKIDKSGRNIDEWYLSDAARTGNRTVGVFGYTGIVSIPDEGTLLVVDASVGGLFKFDMASRKGTPVPLPIEGMAEGERIVRSDAMRLPDKYGGKVLLITDKSRGVVVVRSKESGHGKGKGGKKGKLWERAEYLGLVPNDSSLPAGALTPAVTHMADRIYMVPNWFGERPIAEGTLTGNRGTFYLVDITEEVERLVNG